MDLNRLRVLRAVVAAGSIQSAAEHLSYTPSTVSQHISSLQKETGLKLFQRDGRGIAPTEAGRRLALESREVMAEMSRLEALVARLRDGSVHLLEVSCFSSAATELMPLALGQLRLEFPDLRVEIQLNDASGRETRQPKADVELLTQDTDAIAPAVAGYAHTPVLTEPYVAVMSLEDPLADRPSLAVSELAGRLWVREGSDDDVCSRAIDRSCAMVGFSPTIGARCDDHHTAMSLARAGVGITVLPRLATLTAPPGTVVVPLNEPCPSRKVIALVKESRMDIAPVARLLAILAEVGSPGQVENLDQMGEPDSSSSRRLRSSASTRLP